LWSGGLRRYCSRVTLQVLRWARLLLGLRAGAAAPHVTGTTQAPSPPVVHSESRARHASVQRQHGGIAKGHNGHERLLDLTCAM
jgi:hypothetical protein